MAAPQDASLPPFWQLSDGMKIVLTAISATDGSLVSGVVVSNVSIATQPSGSSHDSEITPPILDPAYFAGEEA